MIFHLQALFQDNILSMSFFLLRDTKQFFLNALYRMSLIDAQPPSERQLN